MKRALLYTALAIALLYAVRAIEYAGLRRASGGEFAKLRTQFETENNFDLLVIGSSRAECQYYTPLLDSATGLKCYNIGMPGATMPLIATSLEAYLVHSNAPKYVVLNLDLHSLGDNNDTVYEFPRYFAFLGNEKLYDGLQQRDGRFFWFKWLPFYSLPYSGVRYMSNSVHGWMGTPTVYDADYEQGFSPCIPDHRWGDLDTATMIVTHAEIPQAVWDGVQRIQTICSERHCTLLFAVSPLFHRQEACVESYPQSFEAFRAYAAEHYIAWIDLGHDPIGRQKEFYADPAHLNKEGALLFTRRFSSALVQYLGE